MGDFDPQRAKAFLGRVGSVTPGVESEDEALARKLQEVACLSVSLHIQATLSCEEHPEALESSAKPFPNLTGAEETAGGFTVNLS